MKNKAREEVLSLVENIKKKDPEILESVMDLFKNLIIDKEMTDSKMSSPKLNQSPSPKTKPQQTPSKMPKLNISASMPLDNITSSSVVKPKPRENAHILSSPFNNFYFDNTQKAGMNTARNFDKNSMRDILNSSERKPDQPNLKLNGLNNLVCNTFCPKPMTARNSKLYSTSISN